MLPGLESNHPSFVSSLAACLLLLAPGVHPHAPRASVPLPRGATEEPFAPQSQITPVQEAAAILAPMVNGLIVHVYVVVRLF